MFKKISSNKPICSRHNGNVITKTLLLQLQKNTGFSIFPKKKFLSDHYLGFSYTGQGSSYFIVPNLSKKILIYKCLLKYLLITKLFGKKGIQSLLNIWKKFSLEVIFFVYSTSSAMNSFLEIRA